MTILTKFRWKWLHAWLYARIFFVHQRTRASIERWQGKRLAKLVEEVAKHVPAYAKLLDAHRISARSIKGLKDLGRLPILDKDFFRNKPMEEYTNNGYPFRSIWKNTSGTSGKPFSVLVHWWARQPAFSDFTCFRFLVWNGAWPFTLDDYKIARIDIRAKQRKNRLFIPMASFRTDPEGTLREIAAFQPDVLSSYTSILLDIADFVSMHENSPLKVRYAVSIGEMLSLAARKRIEQTLDAEVYDRYGMGEVGGAIAIECAQHNGMHINSESVIVEIVDENGTPCRPGECGRVLVTDLLNFSMPFIRYDTGDYGVLHAEVCACGLETPRLFLEGRHAAYLSFSETRINHLEFDGALDGFMNAIVQYQVIKLSEQKLIVRIVPAPGYNEMTKNQIRGAITHVVGPSVSVHVETAAKLEQTPRGKSKIVIDKSIHHALRDTHWQIDLKAERPISSRLTE